MGKPGNFVARICIPCFSYIAPALLVFYVLSKATIRWHYMINRFVGWRMFNAALLVSTIGFLVVHRKRIADLLKHDSVKPLLIIGILGNAVYHEISLAEFAILTYTLFAVAYFRSFNSSIVSRIVNNESRTPAIFALMCIIAVPVLLMFNKSAGAEQMAVYAYYFLVVTVVLRILEMKLNIDRNNEFLDMLKEIPIFCREKLRLVRHKMTWTTVKGIVLSRGAQLMAIYIAVLIVVIAAQALYWIRFQRIFNQSVAYQGSITLLDQDRKLIEISPAAEEALVPIRLVHPFSKPLVWSSNGANPVSLKVVWYDPVKAGEPNDILSEDRIELDTPLFVNESRDMLVKVKRPLLPGGRMYMVHIALIMQEHQQFVSQEGALVKLDVVLQSSRGIKPLTRELDTLRQSRTKLANAMSDHLALLPSNYVSQLDLLSHMDQSGLNAVKIAVTNKSKLPWPAIGSNPVQIGVIWIQKSREQNEIISTRIGAEVFPLAETLLPGQREIVELRFDPLKYPDADEIWVGMVHSKRQWFYRWKDRVIKLTNKRIMTSRDLERIASESYQSLSEAKQLENDNRALRNRINDPSVLISDKYRSHIVVNNASADGSMQASAGAIMDVHVAVENKGAVVWPVGGENKTVSLGILWINKESNAKSYADKIDEQRCRLPDILPGGATSLVDCTVAVRVPSGHYELWMGPVHEGVTWFYEKGDDILKIDMTVN